MHKAKKWLQTLNLLVNSRWCLSFHVITFPTCGVETLEDVLPAVFPLMAEDKRHRTQEWDWQTIESSEATFFGKVYPNLT